MTTKDVQRAVLKINHLQLVMDVSAATDLFSRLRNVEILESTWVSGLGKMEYKVKAPDIDFLTLQYFSEETYATAKLLSKADELAKQGETK